MALDRNVGNKKIKKKLQKQKQAEINKRKKQLLAKRKRELKKQKKQKVLAPKFLREADVKTMRMVFSSMTIMLFALFVMIGMLTFKTVIPSGIVYKSATFSDSSVNSKISEQHLLELKENQASSKFMNSSKLMFTGYIGLENGMYIYGSENLETINSNLFKRSTDRFGQENYTTYSTINLENYRSLPVDFYTELEKLEKEQLEEQEQAGEDFDYDSYYEEYDKKMEEMYRKIDEMMNQEQPVFVSFPHITIELSYKDKKLIAPEFLKDRLDKNILTLTDYEGSDEIRVYAMENKTIKFKIPMKDGSEQVINIELNTENYSSESGDFARDYEFDLSANMTLQGQGVGVLEPVKTKYRGMISNMQENVFYIPDTGVRTTNYNQYKLDLTNVYVRLQNPEDFYQLEGFYNNFKYNSSGRYKLEDIKQVAITSAYDSLVSYTIIEIFGQSYVLKVTYGNDPNAPAEPEIIEDSYPDDYEYQYEEQPEGLPEDYQE